MPTNLPTPICRFSPESINPNTAIESNPYIQGWICVCEWTPCSLFHPLSPQHCGQLPSQPNPTCPFSNTLDYSYCKLSCFFLTSFLKLNSLAFLLWFLTALVKRTHFTFGSYWFLQLIIYNFTVTVNCHIHEGWQKSFKPLQLLKKQQNKPHAVYCIARKMFKCQQSVVESFSLQWSPL